jgi:hypothetical protein
MASPWIILLSAVIGLVAGLFSGLLGRRLEEWWDRPTLKVDFIPSEGGFQTVGKWTEDDSELIEIYIRARVRNESSSVAKKCRPFLVKLEEVHQSGTTPTKFIDSLVLPWP